MHPSVNALFRKALPKPVDSASGGEIVNSMHYAVNSESGFLQEFFPLFPDEYEAIAAKRVGKNPSKFLSSFAKQVEGDRWAREISKNGEEKKKMYKKVFHQVANALRGKSIPFYFDKVLLPGVGKKVGLGELWDLRTKNDVRTSVAYSVLTCSAWASVGELLLHTCPQHYFNTKACSADSRCTWQKTQNKCVDRFCGEWTSPGECEGAHEHPHGGSCLWRSEECVDAKTVEWSYMNQMSKCFLVAGGGSLLVSFFSSPKYTGDDEPLVIKGTKMAQTQIHKYHPNTKYHTNTLITIS